MDRLKDLGIPFGSRRWGGWYDKSDYDRLIMHEEFKEACAYLNVIPARDHKYDSDGALCNDYHVYLDEGKRQYNFLVYKDEKLFKVALEASRQIDVICRTALGEGMRDNKQLRHKVVSATFKATRSLMLIQSGFSSIYSEDSDTIESIPKELSGYALINRQREGLRPGQEPRRVGAIPFEYGGGDATEMPDIQPFTGTLNFVNADTATTFGDIQQDDAGWVVTDDTAAALRAGGVEF